jgi:hypothetical protein
MSAPVRYKAAGVLMLSGDDLAITLFLVGTGITLGAAAMSAAGWKHPVLIAILFGLAALFVLSGGLWSQIKDISQAVTRPVTEIATSPIAWFCVLLVALSASVLFRRAPAKPVSVAPTLREEQQSRPSEPRGQPSIGAPLIQRYGDPELLASARADLEAFREVENRARDAKAWLRATIEFGAYAPEKFKETWAQTWEGVRTEHDAIDEECSTKRKASDASQRRLFGDIYKRLNNGSLVAKGFLKPVMPASEEVTIPASHWRFLRFNTLATEAKGEGIAYTAISITKN